MRWLILCLGIFASHGALADVRAVHGAALAAFGRMPALKITEGIAGICGADASVDARAVYCTSSNKVLFSRDFVDDLVAGYLVAHALGHAVQVRHGVADVALAAIRSRRDEEAELRGMVERQVDCIAGFLLGRAGQQLPVLTEIYLDDPLNQRHWGRDPLNVGPRATVPLAERDQWISRGYVGDLSACAVGEFSAELLLAALKH